MNNDWIAQAGKALFGEQRWLTPFAAALRMDDRNLRRLLAGEEPHAGLRERVRELLQARLAKIEQALADLPKP